MFKPYLIEEMFVDEEHLLLMSRVENHKGEELIEDALMNLKLNN